MVTHLQTALTTSRLVRMLKYLVTATVLTHRIGDNSRCSSHVPAAFTEDSIPSSSNAPGTLAQDHLGTDRRVSDPLIPFHWLSLLSEWAGPPFLFAVSFETDHVNHFFMWIISNFVFLFWSCFLLCRAHGGFIRIYWMAFYFFHKGGKEACRDCTECDSHFGEHGEPPSSWP